MFRLLPSRHPQLVSEVVQFTLHRRLYAQLVGKDRIELTLLDLLVEEVEQLVSVELDVLVVVLCELAAHLLRRRARYLDSVLRVTNCNLISDASVEVLVEPVLFLLHGVEEQLHVEVSTRHHRLQGRQRELVQLGTVMLVLESVSFQVSLGRDDLGSFDDGEPSTARGRWATRFEPQGHVDHTSYERAAVRALDLCHSYLGEEV